MMLLKVKVAIHPNDSGIKSSHVSSELAKEEKGVLCYASGHIR